MKIKKISKKKNNLYEITLDNKETINLYDDIILKYNLLLTKEINDLENIINDNSYLESYYIALKYINSKLRTEKEIKKKLSNYNRDAVNYTINRLKKEGYLNDSLYIKAYVNDAINLKLVGPLKIIFDLKKLGFKEQDILLYLDTFSKDIWFDKISKYIKKKIETNHNLSSIMLKQKIRQDLSNKGFYKEDINLVLENFTINDNKEIYNKEYDKLKNKLSCKYSGEELDYQIKSRLYRKGFK